MIFKSDSNENRDMYRDLNCKIDNRTFSELLIEPFDWLKNYLFQFQTLASKVRFKY